MKKTYSLKPTVFIKKTVSLLLSLVLFVASFVFSVDAADNTKKALPLSAGVEALRDQFESGTADKCGNYALDYCYYSPVGKNDKEKYPIVIYLHGIGHGSYVGSQLDDSSMAYWASKELQSRWTGTGGAFILLPRSPEDQLQYWNKTLIDPLRTLIDSFIEDHAGNVDTKRIFIGGSSAGGEMTWDMAIAYPEYFAGIYPLAATGTRTASDIKQMKNVAVWLFSSSLDPIVSYPLNVLPTWGYIKNHNAHPENCRLSTFSIVKNPDGSLGASSHRLYTTISYDFFTTDSQVYPNVETTDGKGNTVTFKYPKGIISWMSGIRSNFNGVAASNQNPPNPFDHIFVLFRNVFFKIANLFQRLLGFV